MVICNPKEHSLNNSQEDFSSFLDDVTQLKKYQQKETIYRYHRINEILKKSYVLDRTKAKDLRSRLDRVFTHKFFGYFIFLGILALVFQSIFEWSSIPMDFIDGSFGSLSEDT